MRAVELAAAAERHGTRVGAPKSVMMPASTSSLSCQSRLVT